MISRLNHCYLKWNVFFNIKITKYFAKLNSYYMSIFHPLQVDRKLKCLIQRFKG